MSSNECGKLVSAGMMSYPCVLDRTHRGVPTADPEPCMATESTGAVRLHMAWMERQTRDLDLQQCPVSSCGQKFDLDAARAAGETPCCGVEIRDAPPFRDTPPPEPTKQRDGDQPLPLPGIACVQDLIIEAMTESKRVGLERYGSTLMTFNARKGITDIKEEARDLFVYASMLEAQTEATQEDVIAAICAGIKDVTSTALSNIVVEAIAESVFRRIGDYVTTSSAALTRELLAPPGLMTNPYSTEITPCAAEVTE